MDTHLDVVLSGDDNLNILSRRSTGGMGSFLGRQVLLAKICTILLTSPSMRRVCDGSS